MESDRLDRFLKGDESLRDYLGAHTVDLGEVPRELIHDLERRDRSHEFVWAWCRAGRVFGHTGRLTLVICALLARDDHESHEELVDVLQDLRDPRSINCLFDCTGRRFIYLEYNDSSSLARRCAWALHDIGTPEAMSKLWELTSDLREDVAREAAKRLEALRSAPREKASYRMARDGTLGSL